MRGTGIEEPRAAAGGSITDERMAKCFESREMGARSAAASAGCSASSGCSLRMRIEALLLMLACAGPTGQPTFYVGNPASSEESYCAWFADTSEEVLYFGEAAFWSEMRRTGHPEGERERKGPVRIGRFDLAERRLLEPLTVAGREESGTWDVLAHPNGRIYFTTFFGPAGFVEPATGRVVRFGPETLGLNELALGPAARVLATRYGSSQGEGGAIAILEPEGALVAELPLDPPAGYRVAAKSVAWDPGRAEIWVNTDLLPDAGGPVLHDARVLDAEGRERLRFDLPELHFMMFREDGTGYLAVVEGDVLSLVVLPTRRGAPLAEARLWVLDEDFPTDHDFVQDLRPTPDGGVLATRWSGRTHRLRDTELRSYTLPRPHPDGLYYTGVIAADHLCATFCGESTVVCRRID
jgi:hypothetical protein